MTHDDHDSAPRRDPWWVMALGLILLVVLLWFLLDRSNTPDGGQVKEGRYPAPGYSSDSAARRANSSSGAG
jgi:hypothetical protein